MCRAVDTSGIGDSNCDDNITLTIPKLFACIIQVTNYLLQLQHTPNSLVIARIYFLLDA